MIDSVRMTVKDLLGKVEEWFTGALKASWGASFLRIVLGVTLLVELIVNFRFRSYMWGPAAAWSQNLHMNSELPFQRAIFGPTSSLTTMTVAYFVLIAATVAFILGWHTRIATLVVLLLNSWMAFSDGVYMDQSDNFLRMALIYCLFMRVAEHWSLDARRSRNRGVGSPRFVALEPYSRLLHNTSVTAFGAHICLIYVASAMFKTQGSFWQHGTALYYPLNIPHFNPWPELTGLVEQNSLFIFVGTYAAVYFQLFFPFMLLNKYLRKVALLGIVAMHLGIAVLMGLPFFSFFMLAGDSIFVSSKTYQTVDAWVRKKFKSIRKSKELPAAEETSRQEVLHPVS